MLHLTKYTRNRRLYSHALAQYMSLDAVQAVIESGEDISVKEHRSDTDLTSTILLDVLKSKEAKAPRVSCTTLTSLIRTGSPA